MQTNFADTYKTLPTEPAVDAREIISAFLTENTKFKYFKDSTEIHNLYISCYNSIRAYFTEAYLKKNTSSLETLPSDDIILPHNYNSYVYRIMFLFQAKDSDPTVTLSNFDKFAKVFINSVENLKDFFSERAHSAFKFPHNTNFAEFNYDVAVMLSTLNKIGFHILKNIHNLSKIQEANQKMFPKNLEEFKQATLIAKFPSAKENMKLAKLCNHYDGENAEFMEILNLMNIGTLPFIETKDGKILTPKPIDNLPNVMVQYVNPITQSQYHLVKLPSHDFRALMLGNITGNCQTLGNFNADAFIIDGVTLPSSGFYVIIRQGKKSLNPKAINWDNLEKDGHEIVGQSYAWIGKDGKSITWEAPQLRKDRAPNIDIKEMFTAFGREVTEQGFDRVTIGFDMGLKGAKNFIEGNLYTPTYPKTTGHNIIAEGYRYNFSSTVQYEVHASTQLNEIRKQLIEVTNTKNGGESITSVAQGQVLLKFLQGKSLSPTVQKILMSSYLTKEWSIEKLESLLPSLESTPSEKLERMFNNMQTLYKHGLTVEYALNIPEEIAPLFTVLTDDTNKIPLFLESGIVIDEIVRNITPSTSEYDLKKEIVKLMAKHLCNDGGDLGYVDTMSPEKIDFLLNSNESMDILYKKHLTVQDIAMLDKQKFDMLVTNYYVINALCNDKAIFMNSFVEQHDSNLAMKKDMLKFCMEQYSSFNQVELTCDENIVNYLSSEMLDSLLRLEVLQLPNYNHVLEIAETGNIETLTKYISLCLNEGQNKECIFAGDPSENHINILPIEHASQIIGAEALGT